MSKPKFPESEVERYRQIAAAIIDGDLERKKKLDPDVRLAIATAKKQMPTADNEVLAAFFTTVVYLVAHIATTNLRNAQAILDSTFDLYGLAAADIMGAYDVDGDEVPAMPEPASEPEDQEAERLAKLDELINRQYL